MNRKTLIAAKTAAALCAAAVLTGCTLGEDRLSHPERAGISFSWWGKDARNEYTLEGLRQFQQDNEGIIVTPEYSEYEGFKTRMDVDYYSDTSADVMQLNYNWLWEYSKDGEGFYDLYELSDEINLDAFDKDDLAYGEINGKLNAVPTGFNCVTFYYNKTMYEKYGLDLPTNWQDLINAADVMRSDEVYPIALTQKSAWLSAAAYCEQSTGKAMFSEDGEFQYDKEDIRRMLAFYQKMLTEKVSKPAWDFDRKDFENCVVGGVAAWISDAEYYCQPLEGAGFKVVVGDYPLAKRSKSSGWYKKPTSFYAIKKTTKYPEESAKLLDYLVNSEEMALLQGTGKGVPASKAALETLEARDMLNTIQYRATYKMNNAQTFQPMNPDLEDQQAVDAFISASEALYYDRTSLEMAARSTYNKLVELYN